ncbi:MAG: hypothetical protein ACTHM1_04275 [Solirubrobacteraceae bacterium]
MSDKNLLSVRRLGRGALAALVALVVAGVGTALALTIGSGRTTHLQHARDASRNLVKAFVVLEHRGARVATAGDSRVVPAGAVRAATVGDLSVYVWERAPGERTLSRPGAATEPMVCEAFEIHGAVDEAGDGAGCGPAGEIAKAGNVTFGQAPIPGTHTLSPMTVTALVPNGVESVRFTDTDGSSYDVKVTNNVVVVEDGKLAHPPATAVSYRLPDGKLQNVPMPTQEDNAPR